MMDGAKLAGRDREEHDNDGRENEQDAEERPESIEGHHVAEQALRDRGVRTTRGEVDVHGEKQSAHEPKERRQNDQETPFHGSPIFRNQVAQQNAHQRDDQHDFRDEISQAGNRIECRHVVILSTPKHLRGSRPL